MKKAALLLLPLAMASCNYVGLPNGDVSGTIEGVQPSGSIRLAMRGVTQSGFETPSLDQGNVGTFNPEKRAYSISLPGTPADGGYELFAYVDGEAGTKNRYDSGEQKTASRNFLFSKNGTGNKSGSDVFNLKPGWTLLNGMSTGQNGTPFTNVTLNW